MTIDQFVEQFRASSDVERRLLVLNRTEPEPIQSMLQRAFEDQPVTVEEAEVPDDDSDVVALVEDGETVATSPLEALEETVLLVNSDLYKTGRNPIGEFDLPDVLTALDDVPFTLRGYPESNTEKLLLIVISRYIERLAWHSGSGKIRSSFQRLSRIEDERGTESVYRELAETDLDVHLYGVPDWRPPTDFEVVIHGGYEYDFRRSWFVIHVPDEDAESDRHAALCAIETDPRRWRGFWTFQPERVEELNRYVEREL